MTNTPGHLQEWPLIEECADAVRSGEICRSPARTMPSWSDLEPWMQELYRETVLDVLEVLRRRGLINEQGLEIIKREME